MGIIYYSTNTFTVNGVTPLPVSADSATAAIILGYLIGALLAFAFPRRAALGGKLAIGLSLVCTLLLFLPLPETLLLTAFYIMVFCCVLFISADTVLIVSLYSSRAAVVNAICSGVLVALSAPLLQNDLYRVDFRVFNICAVLLQILVLIGLSRYPNKLPLAFLPRQKDLPKEKRSRPPSILLWGTLLLFGASCICALFTSTMAESLPNGIAVAYLGCGAGSLVFLLLFRRGKNPFHLTTAVLASSALGYLLFLLPFAPVRYIGLFLQGPGVFMATLCWFFAGVFWERWPARSFAPLTVLIAVLTVVINAGLLELMRGHTAALYTVYAVFAVAVLLLYFLIKPFYDQAWHDKPAKDPQGIPMKSEKKEQPLTGENRKAELLKLLTPKEYETAELLSCGHSAPDIAKKFFVSVHTVRDHTKSIYHKLNIHKRYQLIALMNEQKDSAGEKQTETE